MSDKRYVLKKIKATRPYFHEGIGPAESIDLGLEIDGDTIMFGTFYFGCGMDNIHGELFEKYNTFIDDIVYRMSIKNHY